MKFLRTLVIWLFLALPALSYASTVYFSPTSVSVTPGQIVTITVIVDPQGSAYTAKVAVSFPPSLLSVSSFSQASGWLPLTQPGYDSTDNASGSLIKTGGMAGGLSSPQAFGTITFVSKASGVANILVTGGTQILNAQSQNTFTGGGQASVNILQSVTAPITPPITQPPVNKAKTSPVRNLMKSAPTTVVTSTTTSTSTVATSSPSVIENSQLVAQASKAKNSFSLLNVIIPLLTFAVGFSLSQRLKA